MSFIVKVLMAACFCCIYSTGNSQLQTPNWIGVKLTDKVSYQTALIKIDNKDAGYEEMVKIPDSSLLKVEIYPKKQAASLFGKDEGKNGVVLVTKRKVPLPVTKMPGDTSAFYVVRGIDTIYCDNHKDALLENDTTNLSWSKFLQEKLHPQVPADNSSPIGIYNVFITFSIKEDGTVANLKVLQDPGYGTGAEVRRAMKNSPLWDAATCNGTPVTFNQFEKITFVVTGN